MSTDTNETSEQPFVRRPRFTMWAGQGLPKGWAENMGGRYADFDGDIVWPIVDNDSCGVIDGFPKPEQMLCWCPTPDKACEVLRLLQLAVGESPVAFGD